LEASEEKIKRLAEIGRESDAMARAMSQKVGPVEVGRLGASLAIAANKRLDGVEHTLELTLQRFEQFEVRISRMTNILYDLRNAHAGSPNKADRRESVLGDDTAPENKPP